MSITDVKNAWATHTASLQDHLAKIGLNTEQSQRPEAFTGSLPHGWQRLPDQQISDLIADIGMWRQHLSDWLIHYQGRAELQDQKVNAMEAAMRKSISGTVQGRKDEIDSSLVLIAEQGTAAVFRQVVRALNCGIDQADRNYDAVSRVITLRLSARGAR